MKKIPSFLFLCIFLIIMVTKNTVAAKEIPIKVITDCSQSLTLEPGKTKYHAFRNESVKSIDGYGIYFIDEKFDFSSEDDGALNINFNMPLFGGGWISIRKEFLSILDLSNTKGIEIELTVKKPVKDVNLRVTLSDIDNLSDFYHHGDDAMWIKEFPRKTLKEEGGPVVLKIPFNEFIIIDDEGIRRSRGAIPTRGHPYRPRLRANPKRVIGFEINLVGSGRGSLVVHRVNCFND